MKLPALFMVFGLMLEIICLVYWDEFPVIKERLFGLLVMNICHIAGCSP